MISFNNYEEIVIDISPVDMRKGINGLTEAAQALLDRDTFYNLKAGKILMLFIGKRGKIMKILGFDAKGEFVISRRLKKGAFQRLRGRVIGSPTLELNLFELEQYWVGNKIQSTR